MAIAEQDIASLSTMFVIAIGIIVHRAGAARVTIPINNEPDLAGIDAHASQAKGSILVNVTLNRALGLLDAAGDHSFAVIKSGRRRVAVVVQEPVDFITDSSEIYRV